MKKKLNSCYGKGEGSLRELSKTVTLDLSPKDHLIHALNVFFIYVYIYKSSSVTCGMIFLN